MSKILIVGLGNPGPKYELTKHNVGYLAVNQFALENQIEFDKAIFNGVYGKKNLFNKEVFVLKPETFMNLSGNCVYHFASYFKIELENIYIVYDDLDTLFGKLKYKTTGSSGGQNGMKHIIQLFNNEKIKRYKIGIGIENRKTDAATYVLSKFSKTELEIVNKSISEFIQKVNHNIQHG